MSSTLVINRELLKHPKCLDATNSYIEDLTIPGNISTNNKVSNYPQKLKKPSQIIYVFGNSILFSYVGAVHILRLHFGRGGVLESRKIKEGAVNKRWLHLSLH